MKTELKNRIISMNCGLARVYELAKTGNLTIQLIVNIEDYYKPEQDLLIYSELIGAENVCSKNGDILFEVVKIHPASYMSARGEGIEAINERIEQNRQNKRPVFDYNKLNPSCIALLETAAEMLDFNLVDFLAVEKIAPVIAQCDNSEIRPEHIAEAIQYRSIRTNQ